MSSKFLCFLTWSTQLYFGIHTLLVPTHFFFQLLHSKFRHKGQSRNDKQCNHICFSYLIIWQNDVENEFHDMIQGLTNQKKIHLPTGQVNFLFHLPSSNSYLPRICAAQIPICPRFANRNRSPTFNIALTSL